MADTTNIQWTDTTFNPWVGCTKISPACDNCYAESWAKRAGRDVWGNNPRQKTTASYWGKARIWQKNAPRFFDEHGRRRRVFPSLCDPFDNQVPDDWRAEFWNLIRECSNIDWQLLTKRPQNIAKMLPAFWDEIKGNVWLGTTVEDQTRANINIPHLLQHDSAVRFLSCEPLLEPVDPTILDLNKVFGLNPDPQGLDLVYDALRGQLNIHPIHGAEPDWSPLDWVIAGGESGPGARHMHPEWVRALRDLCAAAGVPFFFKQWGDWLPGEFGSPPEINFQDGSWMDGNLLPDIDHAQDWCDDWANDKFEGHCVFHRVGKKQAGRLLDGVEHNAFPEVAA